MGKSTRKTAAKKAPFPPWKPDTMYRVGQTGPLAGAVHQGPYEIAIGRFQLGSTVEYRNSVGKRFLRTTVLDTMLGKLYFHDINADDGTIPEDAGLESVILVKS